ncbi:MAG: type II secretion system protein [Phycisphaerales bacterium]|nr:type II secretion system protein [Phycisphaerales bacterium]
MLRPSRSKLLAHPPHSAPNSASAVRSGFTLVELLVVIAIIGILMTLALVVGGRVAKGGERSLTESTIRALDATLTAYIAEREAKFPTYFVDDSNQVFPIIDGRLAGQNTLGAPAQPTIALYLLLAEQVPGVQEALKGIDKKFMTRKQVVDSDPSRIVKDRNGQPIDGLFINDAWGNPIRLVLPRYHGGHGEFADANGNVVNSRPVMDVELGSLGYIQQWRRSYRPFGSAQIGRFVGDGDEGMCVGGRPYFYSAGPDGDPGTRDDNVYTVTPQFPLETRDLK